MFKLALAWGLWTIGLAALGRAFAPLRGTTLRAAWWWAVAAAVAVTGAEAAIALSSAGESLWATELRFAAWGLSFCPAMALMGAKRPQDRAWQLIVLAFWIVLILPAVQSWLLHPNQPLVVHPVWSLFLLALVIVGAVNHLPTRYGATSLALGFGQIFAFGFGQIFAFWPHLSADPLSAMNGVSPFSGMALIGLGMAWVLFMPRRRRDSCEPLDRVWLDFRDWYGTVWALRVQERINAAAAKCGWPVRLGWQGFSTPDFMPLAAPLAPETAAEIETSLRTLLRRFVSPEWIDGRLGRAKRSGTEPRLAD